MAEAYLDVAGRLWPPGDEPVPLEAVFACDPGTPVDQLPGDRRLAVCEALADFVDLKSTRHHPHSHNVANLAAMVAAEFGLDEAQQDRLRRAGLVHDLGKIAVPARLLEEAGEDTDVSRRQGAAPALSAREIEVLRLVAQGASNPDISKALYISRRTAEHDVEHILAKLGVTSRTAAVAYTLTHELLN